MYQKILVPLDGSEQAEYVLDIAGAIAARANAQIALIHVSAAAQVAAMRRDVYLDHTARRMSEKWAIRTTFATLDDERFEPDTRAEVANALFQYACDHAVDLVILTRLGRGGIVRAWLSGVSKNLIRWCPMPVLLWRAAGGMPSSGAISAIQRVVVPLDGSRVAEQILGHAMTLAQLLSARLDLLRVVTPAQLRTSSLATEDAHRYLDEVTASLHAEGVEASHNVTHSESIAQAILDFACAGDAAGAGSGRAGESDAMIAMATHGRAGIARVLLGSIAEGVLDGATTPLMLYRPSDLSEAN